MNIDPIENDPVQKQPLTLEEIILDGSKFRKNFQPEADVDYDWVYELARENHRYLSDNVKEIDRKLVTVALVIGIGTGLYLFGLLAGMVMYRMNAWIFFVSIPSFVLAILAIVFAVQSRDIKAVSFPLPSHAALYIQNRQQHKQPKAKFIGVWFETAEILRQQLDQTSRSLNASLWLFVAAIACLALPVIDAVYLNMPKGTVSF